MEVQRLRTWGVGPWVRFCHFRQFVCRFRDELRQSRILDAGCGAGDHLAWLAGYLPEARLTGYDASAGSTYAGNLSIAVKMLEKASVDLAVQDLKQLSCVEKFDMVYTIDVLEHISGNEVVIRNIHRALVPGGLFYLAMPHDCDRARLLPDRFFRRFEEWANEEHVGEMRSLAETQKLLEAVGFSIVEARYTFGPAARLAWELERASGALRNKRFISSLVTSVLNVVASLEFVMPPPPDGNIRVVCRKA